MTPMQSEGKQEESKAVEHPVVSIVVTVYNHERYIERCLRGIAMQKCSFTYEVLIGEDCSPDGSREVLKRLQAELPDCFHFFYREHNMGDGGDGNSGDLLRRCTGKYLAICEGDDFWTYDGKLQEQVDFLEGHPDYVACFHHCTVVGENSEPNSEKYPDCLKEDYSFKEFFYCTMPGQTATFMARREPYEDAKRLFNEHRLFRSYATDRRNAFILLTVGKVRVFQRAWSAYRHVSAGGTSYSSRVAIDEDYARNEVQFGKTLVAYAEVLGSDEAVRAAKQTYFRLLLKWSVGAVKVSQLGDALRELMRQPGWLGYLLGVPRWYAVLVARLLAGRGVTL